MLNEMGRRKEDRHAQLSGALLPRPRAGLLLGETIPGSSQQGRVRSFTLPGDDVVASVAAGRPANSSEEGPKP
jgi:hypothetical protein